MKAPSVVSRHVPILGRRRPAQWDAPSRHPWRHLGRPHMRASSPRHPRIPLCPPGRAIIVTRPPALAAASSFGTNAASSYTKVATSTGPAASARHGASAATTPAFTTQSHRLLRARCRGAMGDAVCILQPAGFIILTRRGMASFCYRPKVNDCCALKLHKPMDPASMKVARALRRSLARLGFHGYPQYAYYQMIGILRLIVLLGTTQVNLNPQWQASAYLC